jgi:7,8-dihydropterin-6-yl-methyl-4-(beta-D-ribofuranosyl)aminobenzene 5'-phosphate synthase
MELVLTILADNQVDRGDGLLAEHGFCLLVAGRDSRMLLDTGQTDVCLRNASRLGVDLSDVKTVVLSHGHYDHGGGLAALTSHLGKLDVYLHPAAFAAKYARCPGSAEDRHIGLRYDADTLTRMGATVHAEAGVQELGPELLITGEIPRATPFEEAARDFWVKGNDRFHPDPLQDDQALVLRTADGLVVLLGCTHAGVINTLNHAVKLTGDKRIRAVIGGLHLASASQQQIEQTVTALKELGVEQLVACHCTGFLARMRLHVAFGDQFVNGTVGLRLTF